MSAALTAPLTAPLTAADFPAFFAAVHGVPPFPWQDRLLRHVAETGEWPTVLNLPTGAGKTAALDIAVFHLALQAARGPERQAAVRIAFVVDRRLIVDDAFERARRIADALGWALLDDAACEALVKQLADTGEELLIESVRRVRAAPVVAAVAGLLRRLAGPGVAPLLARRLRGGVPREDDWARTPVQPTILCSTVDQVGSRLLFRGYGVSDRMKPIHAGLLGSDCLILLDEAHLAEPFRQTLVDGITPLRGRGRQAAPWQVAVLTATPWKPGEKPFKLHDDDKRDPTLSKRLNASKPAQLIEIAGKQGVATEARRVDELVAQTMALYRGFRDGGCVPAIGVVVNRVARARDVFERLTEELKDELPRDQESSRDRLMLIIGPARDVDRNQLSQGLNEIRTAKGERRLEKPLIVVATQTIEAGVDIDFDGLVSEAAPLDALRQRFGRLNRAGRDIAAKGVVLAHRDDIGPKANDPVYEDRIAKTWDALLAVAPDRVVDFGFAQFPPSLLDDAKALVAPKPDAPVLLPAYVDLWSQTWPIPNADPDVGLFLHGPARAPAGVQIVWRADIEETDLVAGDAARDRILDLLRDVPPRSAETLEVPRWAAQAWLRRQREEMRHLADAPERPPEDSSARGRPAFRFAGTDSDRSGVIFANELRNGDLIVVPASYGGCDQWGWNPGSGDHVADRAEAASLPYRRRRFFVRVTAPLIRQGLREQGHAPLPDLDALTEKLRDFLAEREENDTATLIDALLGWRGEDALPANLREWLDFLQRPRGRHRNNPVFYRDPRGQPVGVRFVAPFGVKKGPSEEGKHEAFKHDEVAPPATESEDIGLTIGRKQLLEEHSEEVRCFAGRFASPGGLDPERIADVRVAAYLHDAGKADRRFQAYLAGGDPFAPYGDDPNKIWAKSGRRSLPKNARERADLPDPWRHEALSVQFALRHADFAGANDKELVLWLIGTHHGFGRPLFPHADDRPEISLPHVLGGLQTDGSSAGPQSLAFSFEGWDWPQLFERLKARYGVWELARLEAFVRLADHRASEQAGQSGLSEEDPE